MRYFEEIFYSLMFAALVLMIANCVLDICKLMHWSVIP